jgi:hypothetical protein
MKQEFRVRNTFWGIIGVLLVLTLFTFHFSLFTVKAHRYHTSLARMDFNEKEKTVEISIQIFTHDLVPALERRAKKRVDLEKTADVDRLIFDYLNENFVLRDKTGATKKLVWVGKELEVDAVWVYLETAAPEGFQGASLQNTILFESFPEQTNFVVARFGGKKGDLVFKVGDKFKEIAENKPKTES